MSQKHWKCNMQWTFVLYIVSGFLKMRSPLIQLYCCVWMSCYRVHNDMYDVMVMSWWCHALQADEAGPFSSLQDLKGNPGQWLSMHARSHVHAWYMYVCSRTVMWACIQNTSVFKSTNYLTPEFRTPFNKGISKRLNFCTYVYVCTYVCMCVCVCVHMH